jgi:hypothetical protein
MMTRVVAPVLQTSLRDALWILGMGAALVVFFYVLRAKARRKARGNVGVLYESAWAPLVPVHNGDVWFDGEDYWAWEHDRWMPAEFHQIVHVKARIAA